MLGLLCKKKYLFIDLLRSWYLFELLQSSPAVKNYKNVIKIDFSKNHCDDDWHLFFPK